MRELLSDGRFRTRHGRNASAAAFPSRGQGQRRGAPCSGRPGDRQKGRRVLRRSRRRYRSRWLESGEAVVAGCRERKCGYPPAMVSAALEGDCVGEN